MLSHEVAKKVLRRRGRSGRLVKGEEAMRRELRAAGGPQDHGQTFNYPAGSAVGATIKLAGLLSLVDS